MHRRTDFALFADSFPPPEDDWTFNGHPTRELTHCYHDYPARMIPQIAGKLYDMYGQGANLMFDPYCGTGTSLVEGYLRGINVIGTDLNPLARLIAKAKTSLPDPFLLKETIKEFQKVILNFNSASSSAPHYIQGIKNLDFWFKPLVIQKLLCLKTFIEQIVDDAVRQFFQVAFSETVRESSNTRIDEFKLFRRPTEKLTIFNPDVFGIMNYKLDRNQRGYGNLLHLVQHRASPPTVKIFDFNTVEAIPEELLAPESVDIVVTSPPYGDSHTTVAYGQYSRLSSSWLGFACAEKVDRLLMGGCAQSPVRNTASKITDIAIEQVSKADIKRGREVFAFYHDLERSIRHVAKVLREGGHACYVVGNRTVKGVILPTDLAVMNYFESCGFEHVRTFTRRIPNKRMPARNSPSNIPGLLENTMTGEFIVIMRKESSEAK